MEKSDRVLGNRYKVSEEVGKGSYGIVYKARNQENEEIVAIKELDLSGLSGEETREILDDFKKEIDYLKGLDHPNLVRFLDYFTENDRFYIVTEFVEGADLKSLLDKMGHPFRGRDLVSFFFSLADMVEYMHKREIPYYMRILKPTDVMVTQEGEVKIIDLGLAIELDPRKIPQGYFLPEEPPDEQRDVFIIGALIYELVTGIKPAKYRNRAFKPAKEENENISKVLSDIIVQCVDSRKRRFKNVRELKRSLLRWFPEYVNKDPNRNSRTLEEEMAAHEKSIAKSKVSCAVCAVIALFLIAFCILFLPGMLNKYRQENLNSCAYNLEKIGGGLNKYFKENKRYPESLHDLIPKYIDSLPVCPAANNSQVYLDSYRYNDQTGAFTIYCKGHYHKGANIPEDYPLFSRKWGLVKTQKDDLKK